MLPSQAGAGNGAAAALARDSGLGRPPVPRGANGGGGGGGGAAAGPPGGRLEREALYSGSEGDSESAEEEELGGERRGVKRGLAEAAGAAGPAAGAAAGAYGGGGGGGGGDGGAVSGAKPGKKTRGRVKIKMEFIDNKLRRYTTFSKRKTGIMKKAYELSTLTGTQVLLLVASETGHVYTFATRKLQPMITSETGKALIQTCLNSPDSPPRSDPTTDQRMSATGFEETDLTYQVSESDSSGETKDALKPAFTITNLPGTTSTIQTAPTTSTSMQVSSGPSFPITNYLAPVSASISPNAVTSANGTVLKTTGASAVTSGGLMPIPTGFTLMSGASLSPGTPTMPLAQLQPPGQVVTGTAGQLQQAQQTVFRFPARAGGQIVSLSGGTMAQQVPVQAIQVHQAPQQTSPSSDSSTDLTQTSSSGTVCPGASDPPGNHHDVVRANHGGWPHDVPQPTRGDVRAHIWPRGRWTCGPQRFLTGTLSDAGVPWPGPGSGWCPPSVPDSPIRHRSDPSLSCPASPDGCHRAAEQQWQQPHGAAGGQLGHLAQRQE
ncbi:serum response factor isoform X1 [Tyto alba]|uniref:serum response factor isoform X1 n=1 Tax=Tyto alba TaxID=56313 RepID=UPI001C66428D|nr:serum response factor isoform X1 [Tyto alba]